MWFHSELCNRLRIMSDTGCNTFFIKKELASILCNFLLFSPVCSITSYKLVLIDKSHIHKQNKIKFIHIIKMLLNQYLSCFAKNKNCLGILLKCRYWFSYSGELSVIALLPISRVVPLLAYVCISLQFAMI